MSRFATNLVSPTPTFAVGLPACLVLISLAGCAGTIDSTPTDGPQDGLAGTRLAGPAADPGPKFGVQRSGVAVRLWTLPPSARLPDRLVQIFDQPKSAGDASEAAEPWRTRGFLAATIPLADVQLIEQALATLPAAPSGAEAAGSSTSASSVSAARRADAPASAGAAEDDESLSIQAATRRAQQQRRESQQEADAPASSITSDAGGGAGPQQPVLPSPRPAEPARPIAPARVESLALRPTPEPSVILRASLRDQPWALMQVSGSMQRPSRVPAGQPMLMGRIWPRPGIPLPSRGFSALMRLELTAALTPGGLSRAVRQSDAPLPLTDEPLVFDLPHHRALVLSAPVDDAPSRASRSGPEVEKPPSLAQALLTTPTGERVVIVLIPTLPGVFTLQDLSAPPAMPSIVGSTRAINPQPASPPPPRESPSVSPLMER